MKGVAQLCGWLVLVLVLVSLERLERVAALDNGVGLVPAMGWSTWNSFGPDINEQLIRDSADVLVSSGLRDVGYVYLNIDDGWQNSQRDVSQALIPDPKKFPSGLENLSDYLHGKGLKLGIYSARGNQTCAGNPGSAYFESTDAAQFAAWGVDYLKYDSCHLNRTDISEFEQFARMRDALNSTQRPIYYSICETFDWPATADAPYGYIYSVIPFGSPVKDLANAWLTERMNSYDTWNGMVNNADSQQLLANPSWSGTGHWNDADMLQICRSGMQYNEYQSHFALWAILASPLILGNDLRSMTSDCMNIIGNKEVVSINQDVLGYQGVIIDEGVWKNTQIFAKPLANGKFAVLFFNRVGSVQPFQLNFQFLGAYPWPYDNPPPRISFTQANVRDVINHSDFGFVVDHLAASVQAHSVNMFIIEPLTSLL